MEYCSINDAFPNLTDYSAREQRKEERRKAKRCKGPPLSFLEPDPNAVVTDPDRPALRPKPIEPPLNKETGLREHAPVDAPPLEPFQDLPPVYGKAGNPTLKATLQSEKPPADLAYLNKMPKNVAGPTKQQPIPAGTPAFFGANLDEDMSEGFASFTNVIGDDPAYRLSPDFGAAFGGKGVPKAGSGSALPIPVMNNFWKPLTPAGARTAFFDSLPAAPKTMYPEAVMGGGEESKQEIFQKLDRIFARLDDLEIRRKENAQTEVVLFVMSGIFILFSMDLLVRKTGNVRIAGRR